MIRGKETVVDQEFLEELANNSPNAEQFDYGKKANKNKKNKKKNKKILREPDTGWSGIV